MKQRKSNAAEYQNDERIPKPWHQKANLFQEHWSIDRDSMIAVDFEIKYWVRNRLRWKSQSSSLFVFFFFFFLNATHGLSINFEKYKLK